MRRLLAYLLRFAAIVAGFGAASLAASAFLHFLLLGGFDWRPHGPGDPAHRSALLFSVPFVALVAGYLAFLPALPVIVAAETFGRRDWLFHALGGGAVALVVTAIVFGRHGIADPASMPAMVAAGMAAGSVYWLIAGRNAGRTLDRLVSGREP